jgi:beta-1,4-mannooligosaccharide/beta-1,4-mannosyl-N-acetylglucosamine phosphorylase
MVTRDVFLRWKGNPIFTTDRLPFKSNGVFNPGVALVDGEVVLLLRIEDQEGTSHLRVARSANGVDHWRLADKPLLDKGLPEYPFEEWGCEDPRITPIGDHKWIIAYTAYSRYGPAVGLAATEDFEKVERLGIALSPSNKDATVFPHRIDGRWFMLHRPVTGAGEHIWYASTDDDDFSHWGQAGVLFPERGGPWWDGLRVGVGAPPIATDEGWLLIYHGVKETTERPIYRLGLALLDTNDPRRVLERSHRWVFGPEAPYEQQGLAANVVYTCGAVVRDDEVWMYYGAADTSIGLAVAKLRDLLAFVHEQDTVSREGRYLGMIH